MSQKSFLNQITNKVKIIMVYLYPQDVGTKQEKKRHT